jgi:hypothetical protein
MKAITESKTVSEGLKEALQPNSYREMSLWIDSYDDIFSDFDPRPFSARNISDDFLNEVRKVSGESDFIISNFRLLMPEKLRNSENENIIIKRLHLYLLKNQNYFLKEKRALRNKGLLFTVSGFAMMIAASLVSSIRSEYLLMHILLVIFEPAGWFLVWTGMENLINTSRKQKPELEFYSKLSKTKIIFSNI